MTDAKVLQLKVSLNGVKPEMWRTVLVKDSISFRKLHDIIQKTMGWESYHMFEFCIGDVTLTCEEEGFNRAEGAFKKLFSSPEFAKMLEQRASGKGSARLDLAKMNEILMGTEKAKPADRIGMNSKLHELIKSEGQMFAYRYDFGDCWEHSIIVEKILEKDASKSYPVCIGGEMACPPEDCGGVYGYAEMLTALKDKRHPEHKRWREWIGEFDPEKFDMDRTNLILHPPDGRARFWVKKE